MAEKEIKKNLDEGFSVVSFNCEENRYYTLMIKEPEMSEEEEVNGLLEEIRKSNGGLV